MNERVSDFKLFIPGPTPVADEVLQMMSTQVFGHREKRYRDVHVEVRELLKSLYQTKQRTFALTCSASVVMDLLARQSVRPGRVMLCLTCGAFSERWQQMAQANGIQTRTLKWEWGQAYEAERLHAELQQGDIDAVTFAHNETSTGVMNNLNELLAVIRQYEDVMVLVDAVSSLGAVDINFDHLGLDACLAGVQKDLACPPGVAVLAVSQKLLQRAGEIPNHGWALDLIRIAEKDDDGYTLSTPSMSHMFALRKRLQYMEDEGARMRWKCHEEMSQFVRSWALKRFDLFAPEGYQSQTLTSIACPEDFGIVDFLKKVEQKTGYVVGSGYGKIKPTTFRVAHMGECRLADLEKLIEAIESCF